MFLLNLSRYIIIPKLRSTEDATVVLNKEEQDTEKKLKAIAECDSDSESDYNNDDMEDISYRKDPFKESDKANNMYSRQSQIAVSLLDFLNSM